MLKNTPQMVQENIAGMQKNWSFTATSDFLGTRIEGFAYIFSAGCEALRIQ